MISIYYLGHTFTSSSSLTHVEARPGGRREVGSVNAGKEVAWVHRAGPQEEVSTIMGGSSRRPPFSQPEPDVIYRRPNCEGNGDDQFTRSVKISLGQHIC